MTTAVFTYGSLMFAEVWSRVVIGRYRSMDARLRDHARFSVRDQDYPGMIAGAGAVTRGLVYFDVTDEDVERLDRFEGDEYRRTDVVVELADGTTQRCGTYLYLPVDRLLDVPWQPEAFAMDRFLAYRHDWPAPRHAG